MADAAALPEAIADAAGRTDPAWHVAAARLDARHDPWCGSLSCVTEQLTPLQQRLREIFERRDRANMKPTIDALRAVLEEHPEDPEVLYELGGAYDTAGQEETAVGYYEQSIAAGLSGDALRRCLIQYGSTLRNLARLDDSLQVFVQARRSFPDSESVRVFEALTLHAAGRPDASLAGLLELIADQLRTPEILRYEVAIRGNAAYLANRDR